MDFWKLKRNGGDGWCVGDLPEDCAYDFGDDNVTKYFATSFELCQKKQVIDLLAEGFSPEDLDAQPAVTVKDHYSGLGCCGCIYKLKVRLLNENKEVLQEFKPEPVTLDPDQDDMSWRQVSHTFSDYGPGLRFISFEHGGKDTKWWKGHYGVRVTGSSVTIETTQASPARNLLKNPSGNDASPEQSCDSEMPRDDPECYASTEESSDSDIYSDDLECFFISDQNFSQGMGCNLLYGNLHSDSEESTVFDEQMEFWEVIRNGGDGWGVGDLPEDCGFGDDKVTKYFATSFELCLKKQVIDLLAEGFSPEDLDAQPAVTVKDYYRGLDCCGCIYKLTVRLLNENKEVLREFKPETVTLDPDHDNNTMSWRQMSHTFSDYGSGLRFISFEHGGKDTKWWKGRYGVRVTGSSVTIETMQASPARNLLKNIDGNGASPESSDESLESKRNGGDAQNLNIPGRNLLKNPAGAEQLELWKLKRNGGDGWCVGDLPEDCAYDFGDDKVTKYFATSFELCQKKQVIDLLAEGYTPDYLDAQPPVTVKDYYSGLGCCGCIYKLTVRLLDKKKKVIQEFKPEPVTLDPDHDDMSWRQVSHTFSDYGPGLRFISFKHGGKDTKWWKGHYGVRVTGSSVTIGAPRQQEA
uniref:FBA domain-containing protein n=1 Tax=Esox lucius TaxID=8010 RepID=A0A3P8ZNT8_ESOLU